jgi:hypothetical protein
MNRDAQLQRTAEKKQASLKDVMMGFIIYLKVAGSLFIGNYSVL